MGAMDVVGVRWTNNIAQIELRRFRDEEEEMMDETRINRVKAAAEKLLDELIGEAAQDVELRLSTLARTGIVQVALSVPMAMIGNCESDGTELHFEGRSSGLYVCCAGNPRHCWKV